MEILALILFYISLIGILISIGLIIYNVVKKEFKHKKKKLILTLSAFLGLFIGSTIFYGAVQSPESKAKYEAGQKLKEEEKTKKELAKQEKNAQEDKQKVLEENETKEQIEAEIKTKTEVTEDVPVEKEETPIVDDRFTIKSEANTTAAVDELYYKAKEKAATATEDDLKEAIKFIRDNYNNYWIDNDIMQKTMYYGSLLECMTIDKAKSNPKSNEHIIYDLGADTVQAVKYVYRNVDKIEDESTQSNLKQIQKSLDKIK